MNYNTRRRMIYGAVAGVFAAMLALAACGAAEDSSSNEGDDGIRIIRPEPGVTCYLTDGNGYGDGISCINGSSQ